MDPNQLPQQPSTNPSINPAAPPQPQVITPMQAVPQPQPQQAVTPAQPVAAPAPEYAAAPQAVAPAPAPVQPNMAAPGMPAQPVMAPAQAQPMPPQPTMGGMPAQFQAGVPGPLPPSASRFNKKIILLIVGLLAVVLLAIVLFIMLGSPKYKEEVSLGSKYITAIQNKDVDAYETYIPADVKKVGDRTFTIAGQEYKDKFYDALMAGPRDYIPSSGSAKKISAIGGKSGTDKYVAIVYAVGSKKITLLEVYEADKPVVLGAQAGEREISQSSFDSYTKSFKTLIDDANDILDQAEEQLQSGTTQSSTTLKNLLKTQ